MIGQFDLDQLTSAIARAKADDGLHLFRVEAMARVKARRRLEYEECTFFCAAADKATASSLFVDEVAKYPSIVSHETPFVRLDNRA